MQINRQVGQYFAFLRYILIPDVLGKPHKHHEGTKNTKLLSAS